jgi:hypothetical protein
MTRRIDDTIATLLSDNVSVPDIARVLGIPYATCYAKCVKLGKKARHVDWNSIQRRLDDHIPIKQVCQEFNISKNSLVSAGVQRGKLTYPDGYTFRSVNSKYSWNDIRHDYEEGLSYTDLMQKYGVSYGSLQRAKYRGDIVPRTQAQSLIVRKEMKPESFVRSHTTESRDKISAAIQQRYNSGWMPKAGRCKKIQYNSPVAGSIVVDGTWELKVAKWLDSVNLQWKRNTIKFPYVDMDGKPRTYTPDFNVVDYDLYVEVKGYETQLDRLKWQYFPSRLKVWKKDVISQLTEGELNEGFNFAC